MTYEGVAKKCGKQDIGLGGYWWSATPYNTLDAWKRSVVCGGSQIYRYFIVKSSGLSVRCVRD
jgi:hypothetical protein